MFHVKHFIDICEQKMSFPRGYSDQPFVLLLSDLSTGGMKAIALKKRDL